jgi:hypothetical protein
MLKDNSIMSVTRAPPKAEVVRSNRIGSATFSRQFQPSFTACDLTGSHRTRRDRTGSRFTLVTRIFPIRSGTVRG